MFGRGMIGIGGQGVYRREDEGTERVLPNRLIWEGILWSELAVVFFWLIFIAWREAAIVVTFLVAAEIAIRIAKRREEGSWETDWIMRIGAVFVGLVVAAFVWHEVIDPAFMEAAVLLAWALDPILRIPRWFWLILIVIWAWFAARKAGTLAAGIILALFGAAVFAFAEWPRQRPPAMAFWTLVRVLSFPHLAIPMIFLTALATHNWFEALIGARWPPMIAKVDWRRSGMWGLFFPRLVQWDDPGEVIEVEVSPDHYLATIHRNGHNHGEEPLESSGRVPVVRNAPDAVDEFLFAVLRSEAGDLSGAKFKEKRGPTNTDGALEYAIPQGDWIRLKGFFLDQGLAEKHGNQHVLIEPDAHSFIAQRVVTRWGIAAVPEEYRTVDYLGDLINAPLDGGP